MTVVLSVDSSELRRLVDGLTWLATEQRQKVLVRALNRTGDATYTRTVRVVTDITGAQQKQIRRELKKKRSSGASSPYVIHARGPFTSLKAYRPVQRRAGVSAAPWKKRRLFPGTFIGPGGHVYRRKGEKRHPIVKLWGPAIPREMVSKVSLEAMHETIKTVFPARVLHETTRAIDQMKARQGL
jgi:hypothetical protein